MSSPCYNCADRELGCHAWCDAYRAYVDDNISKNQASRLKNEARLYQMHLHERLAKKERQRNKR